MVQLEIVKRDGLLAVDSRDIAEMTSVRHSDLLEKIDVYVMHLTNGEFRSLDFFIPGEYRDSKGEVRRKFDCTRKGCDMIANKMTGEKGVLFTAAYVTKFEEMERAADPMHGASPELRAIFMVDRRTQELTGRIDHVERKLDEQITIDHGEARRLQRAISKAVYDHSENDENRKRLFPELHREIKDRFGVASYRDVKRKEYPDAIRYVEAWMPKRR
ncbi:Rha family transcriptional regulator [Cohnella sp. GbtcB17]|uniref:Rha family transcriptional regulator n=1 Tax=Cohnella sp. GbtcB17 TaxID=2824762 RepID=UPI001C2F9AAE|nr:Rha family transcriptional regulator [Cohnella sp. GbtcB17]